MGMCLTLRSSVFDVGVRSHRVQHVCVAADKNMMCDKSRPLQVRMRSTVMQSQGTWRRGALKTFNDLMPNKSWKNMVCG